MTTQPSSSPTDQSSAYGKAGVDIDAKYQAVTGSSDAIRSTFTKGVVSDVGSFGGLFDPAAMGAGGELLVASADGVGTKVMVAQRFGHLASVGEDLVNHCVGDILVQGARPLFFLDYVAMSVMDPDAVQQVLQGLASACRANGCALLGGETAEMPGVYRDGELDVAGCIVGAVSRDRLIDGSAIRPGDALIGLPSSGLHTNGYSLARKIYFEDGGLDVADRIDDLDGASVGEALLAVHKSYLNAVMPVLDAGLAHGLAHITGGGLPDNLPRVLPEGSRAVIQTSAVPQLPVFRSLCERGKLPVEEAWRVFNMGCGFVVVTAPESADKAMELMRAAGEAPFPCGEVVAGPRGVELQ